MNFVQKGSDSRFYQKKRQKARERFDRLVPVRGGLRRSHASKGRGTPSSTTRTSTGQDWTHALLSKETI